MSEVGWLNIYGAESWHRDVVIAGDRRALELLRAAIDDTLACAVGLGRARGLSAADGEGYDVLLMVARLEELQVLVLPYTDPVAAGGGGKDWPEMVWHRLLEAALRKLDALPAPDSETKAAVESCLGQRKTF